MAEQHEASITFIDKAGKTSNTGLYLSLGQVTEYNTDQTAGDAFDWFAAMAELSLLPVVKQSASASETNLTPLPTDDSAYRSSKLRVFYHDPTTDVKGNFQLPGRDPSQFNTYPRSKEVILTVAAGGTAAIEALVAATQALYTKDGHHPVVDQIVIAGGAQ
jgi:hypothetical protein